ncbi:HAD-IIIC family phosphatase [Mucilaginibacter sp. HD30]
MKSLTELKKNLKKSFDHLKHIKIALLGDSATQLLNVALRGTGYDEGLDLQIWESDFGQIDHQVFDSTSELYAFKPDIVIIFQSSHKLLGKYNKLEPAAYSSIADEQLNGIDRLYNAITAAGITKVIFYNYLEIDDSVFGNYANKTEQSFLFQIRKLNYRLMVYAGANPDFYLCDISSIQNQLGKAMMFHASAYVSAEMVFSVGALPLVAARTVAILSTLNSNFKKCLILDLDNTLWGGIIGDDGIENIQLGGLGLGKAFTEFQYWIKKLKNRGVILAVCSKNTETIAKEVFEKHPDMVLHLDDIAVFKINWNNKVDNIRQIQSILNIGFDSMVFLDDNPFERNMVKENIPAIAVPELPEDPAEYLEYLYTLNLFETVSVSQEDTKRTEQYQKEALRNSTQAFYTNENDYLKSLNMLAEMHEFNKFYAPRVAQLSQRSNQFNLRTIRYTESDIEALSNQPGIFSYAFTLEDRFGDNGLISFIVLKHESPEILFIENWAMSCRVLKRGMENFALNTIVSFARQAGYSYIKGEYIPTAKNQLVRDHYQGLGFEQINDYWFINVKSYKEKPSFIKKK